MVNVRWAELRDLQDLYRIYANDREKHAKQLKDYPVALWITGEDKLFFVAEKTKHKRIGFVVGRQVGKEVRIDFLSVHRKAEDPKDVKEALIYKLEEVAPNAKISMYVPNQKARIKMYEDLGFELQDIFYDMYGKRKHGALIIRNPSLRKVRKVLYPKTVVGEILQENLEKLEALEKVHKED